MSNTPQPSQDRPNRIPWPPIVYAAVLLGAWLLQRFVPLPASMPRDFPINLIGWLLFAAGIAAGLAGIFQFGALGTTVDPTGRASSLAASGIYAYTRNPMYLGAVLAFVGLSFALGSYWLLILTLVMIVLLTKLAIEPEEAYLSRRFGADYAAYRTKVRRWL